MASTSKKGSFSNDLHSLLESGEGSDVTFVVGSSQLPAHSFILSARSSVFAAMLRSDMQEANSRRIEVTDIREDVLRQVLMFIYTDRTPQLVNMAAELLRAADKYDLSLLKERCELQLVRDIKVENAADLAALAVLHRCQGLRSAAVEFIAGHRGVMATAGWQQLLRGSPEAAVEICGQLAATPGTAVCQQLPETRMTSEKLKQKMGARLTEAARSGRTREVWALLTAGAPKGARDGTGSTALHLAAGQGHASTVRCLLDGGLDVNAVNSSGQTPLHLAAQKEDTDVLWMLVAASARVDAQDNQGETPLHVAAKRSVQTNQQYSYSSANPVRMVVALLLAGARKDLKNANGKTPEGVATSTTKCAFSSSCSPYYDL